MQCKDTTMTTSTHRPLMMLVEQHGIAIRIEEHGAGWTLRGLVRFLSERNPLLLERALDFQWIEYIEKFSFLLMGRSG